MASTSSAMPSPAAATGSVGAGGGAGANARSSRAAQAEGITFDSETSSVRFHADDLSRCVPLFLEQWERLSKVIIIAGEGEFPDDIRYRS